MEKQKNKKFYTKWWFWVIVGICFVILTIIWNVADNITNPTQNNPPVETVFFKVNAADIMNEFKSNEINAKNKYQDKLIEITGRLDTIHGKGILGGSPYIVLREQYEFNGVFCDFSDENELTALSTGESVTVQGKFSGYTLGNVMIDNCEIVNNNQNSNTPLSDQTGSNSLQEIGTTTTDQLNPIITLKNQISEGLPSPYKNMEEWNGNCSDDVIFQKCGSYGKAASDNSCTINGINYNYDTMTDMLNAQGCNDIIIKNGNNYDWHNFEIWINDKYILRLPKQTYNPLGPGEEIQLDSSVMPYLEYLSSQSEKDSCLNINNYDYIKYAGQLCDLGQFGFAKLNEPIHSITIKADEGSQTRYFN